MAPDKDRMAAQLFLQALFPLLKVVLKDNPKIGKKFKGVNARIQFVAKDDRQGDLGAYLLFNNGTLEIVQGICPDPDLAFKFSSVKRMAAMLAGKPALFRIGGFYRVGLLVKLLTLLMSLTLLMPNARPKDPDKKRMKVKLSIYMMAAALSRYNKLGNPEINKWTGKQPERIYQFSVIGEDDIASYLRIKAGNTQAASGRYTKRKPFVHMKFRTVDEAIPVLANDINMVKAVEKGYLSLEGSPEYARDVGNFLMRIQALIMG